MSLINLLRKENRKLLFTTPSHSQKFFIFNKFRQFYKYDISETDAHNPQEALKKAEKRASIIYKTKYTHFLTNGSTSGIIAAVLSCVKLGEKVLIWKNAHQSHENAVKLAGAIPVYYDLPVSEEWGVPQKTTPDLINVKGVKGVKAVIVTSPSYEGITSDIKDLKDVCEKNNAYLIVDEAHHIAAKTWKEIKLNFESVGKPVLLFTATPFRNDGGRIEGETIYNYPLSLAQRDKYYEKKEK